MRLSRKELLVASAAALLPAAWAPGTVSAESANASFVFDEARFAQVLSIPARHKQCVAATKIAGGAALDAMLATLYAYEFDLHEGPGTAHEVAVFYHPEGIMLGFGDAAWNEFLIPALPYLRAHVFRELHVKAAVPGKGNPYLHRDKTAALADDSSIEALASRGCHFFICNNALNGLADTLGAALHKPANAIYVRLRDDLVPNGMLVPAGVMAIDACQQAQFTYLQAAL
jgi:intracellular sulfur oxidation DsrE/DsrF family protein